MLYWFSILQIFNRLLLIIAITLLCAIFSASNLYGNTPLGVTFLPDSTLPDSSKIKADSLSVSINDSLKPKKKSFLESEVSYQANDSMRFSVKEQKMYLYDSASVDYESMNLTANYIEIDLKELTNEIIQRVQEVKYTMFLQKTFFLWMVHLIALFFLFLSLFLLLL